MRTFAGICSLLLVLGTSAAFAKDMGCETEDVVAKQDKSKQDLPARMKVKCDGYSKSVYMANDQVLKEVEVQIVDSQFGYRDMSKPIGKDNPWFPEKVITIKAPQYSLSRLLDSEPGNHGLFARAVLESPDLLAALQPYLPKNKRGLSAEKLIADKTIPESEIFFAVKSVKVDTDTVLYKKPDGKTVAKKDEPCEFVTAPFILKTEGCGSTRICVGNAKCGVKTHLVYCLAKGSGGSECPVADDCVADQRIQKVTPSASSKESSKPAPGVQGMKVQ